VSSGWSRLVLESSQPEDFRIVLKDSSDSEKSEEGGLVSGK
jgi:hypothetical protein